MALSVKFATTDPHPLQVAGDVLQLPAYTLAPTRTYQSGEWTCTCVSRP